MSNRSNNNTASRNAAWEVGVPLMLIRHAQKHRAPRPNLTVVAD